MQKIRVDIGKKICPSKVQGGPQKRFPVYLNHVLVLGELTQRATHIYSELAIKKRKVSQTLRKTVIKHSIHLYNIDRV